MLAYWTMPGPKSCGKSVGHYTFPGVQYSLRSRGFLRREDKINKTARISRPLSGAIAVNHKLQERASQVT
jgi:hypothetical protein